MSVFRHTARGVLLITGLIGLLAGCVPSPVPTPTADMAPTAVPPAATANRLIVTLTPAPTSSPVPTPTLPFDVSGLLGRWRVSLDYTLLGDPLVSEVRYVGTLELQVKGDGTLTGNAVWQASANHPPCAASTADENPLEATASGRLTLQDDGSVTAEIQLSPAGPSRTTTVQIVCSVGAQPTTHVLTWFWPALEATGGAALHIPLRGAYSITSNVDLNGPSAGGLRGSLVTQILVSR